MLAPPWLAFSALSHWTISSSSFKAQPPSYVPSSVKPSGCPTPAGSGFLSAGPSVIDICCAQGQCLPRTSWQSKAQRSLDAWVWVWQSEGVGSDGHFASSSGGLLPLRGQPSQPRKEEGQRGASVAAVRRGHQGSPRRLLCELPGVAVPHPRPGGLIQLETRCCRALPAEALGNCLSCLHRCHRAISLRCVCLLFRLS